MRASRNEHVLVVDDEEHLRTIVKQMLEHYGFRVSLCTDGRDALNAYKRHRNDIDLVLMDITMPHMDGIEAYKALVEFDPDVRVVLMSGYNEQQATNALTGRSFSAFLRKPFLPEVLHKVVVAVLDQPTD